MDVVVAAPAKINLSLSVGPTRPDGFHEIDTIFQTVSLFDTVRLSPRAGAEVELTVEHPGVPSDATNLAYRAAEALIDETGCPGVSIGLDKRIPVAAGLGGGSADAAAVLVGMNALHRLGLGLERLEGVAATIGSDVPFFLSGGTARGRGRGEVIEVLPPWGGGWLVLATPRIAVSARDAYDWARIRLTEGDVFTRLNCSGIQNGRLRLDEEALFNDLETGVVAAHPEVEAAREALLEAGASCARMSGSGPTVFGLAGGRDNAERIASRLRVRDWTIHVVEPIDTGCRVT